MMSAARMLSRSLCVGLVFRCALCLASANPQSEGGQAAHDQPLLSPGAALQQAMQPVELTRQSIANWSDIEQEALAVAVKQAADACAARNPKDYTGDSLIDLGRLCTLGLGWPNVIEAASRYLDQNGDMAPHAQDALASKINAELELKNEKAAAGDTGRMLAAGAYTSATAAATTEFIRYARLLYTADAISVAEKREPLILNSLDTLSFPATDVSEVTLNAAAPRLAQPAPLDAVELYREALVLAELYQLDGQPQAAGRVVKELDRAVPEQTTSDELASIREIRHRYDQIGAPLNITQTLLPGSLVARAHIAQRGTVTALLLFPDWCAQGARLAKQMPVGAFSVSDHRALMYGLLVRTAATMNMDSGVRESVSKTFSPVNAMDYLSGTQTFQASSALLDTFGTDEFPLLIVADATGIIRFIEVADETALQPGKDVDAAVSLVGSSWPASPKAISQPVRNSAAPLSPVPRGTLQRSR